MSPSRRALTLLELLLALGILSSVFAAGSSILQDSRRAILRARESMAAIGVFNRWSAELVGNSDTTVEDVQWSWADGDDRRWHVHREWSDPVLEVTNPSRPKAALRLDEMLVWGTCIVERDSRGDRDSPIVLEVPCCKVRRREPGDAR